MFYLLIFLLPALAVTMPQLEVIGDANFVCPEPNGFFPDAEMCDVFYECKNNIPVGKLCEDGLLYNDTDPNCGDRCCDYPFNVDCKNREFVQEPQKGIDKRCYRANGYFNHIDETVCTRFYQCVHGQPIELPCAKSLWFDEAQGTCVRPDQASSFARVCEPEVEEKPNVAGFQCPSGDVFGANAQKLAHPTFPHPEDCQKYVICFFGKEINERACVEGEVFAVTTYGSGTCVKPEDIPADSVSRKCQCWYSCPENSPCENNCAADCSCPSNVRL